MSYIPVLDFSAYSREDERQTLAKEICKAMETVGFLYLKNHGIPQSQAEAVFAESVIFFNQPEEKKLEYCQSEIIDEAFTTYVRIGQEQLTPNKKELRESFEFVPAKPLKNGVPENFEAAMRALELSFRGLALKLLHCIGLGLGIEKESFFVEHHTNLASGAVNHGTMCRTLYYPPYQKEDSEKDDVIRLGSHSDYGTLTMLIQDDIGGLEIEHVNGEYVPADPIAGTVMINIGDLLQRWTNDRLKATNHRVLMNDSAKSSRARQSIAMFIHPDDDTMVEGLDGYSKYPPILARDHCRKRYSETFL